MLKHFLKKDKKEEKRIYLDYAAATPVREEVFDSMKPYFGSFFANPSAIHQDGVLARSAIESSRGLVAKILKIRSEGVVFTASGTESNNLAICGLVKKLNASGVLNENIEIISTKIEHPSVAKVLENLREKGITIKFVKVDEFGKIEENDLESLLSKNTRLVTFAYVNSEIGVIQEVKRITRKIRKFNKENNLDIVSHLDASQAPLWMSCELDMLGVDMMTLDAGKCYGPKGVGVLALRYGIEISPVVLGGDQEGGLRAGTENTALVIGCAKALEVAQDGWKARTESVIKLRDFMIGLLLKEIDGAVLNGPMGEGRVANNINISIPEIDSEFAVIKLDVRGVSASTKSACSGASGNGSGVVREISNDEGRATSTIRFTLGETSTKNELVEAIEILKEHVEKMRNMSNGIAK